MSKEYILKAKDVTLGIITYNEIEDRFSFGAINKKDNYRLYPVRFYGLEPLGTLNLDKIVTDDDIRCFLEDRTYPRNRQGLSEILRELNMQEWNLVDFCDKTRMINLMDYYWLARNEKELAHKFITRE
ncbi:hypothetical protein [Clostridium gasigenes]|uniref:HipA N-terminal domain-containing protein n=1 Tax=Clostridium gasigenes TaxID=94869 RepID=A0A1H0SAM2_9CLOT|nr:hypothetical protein [Clostridium gasigenes]SDP38569.1 hypothetical protein SAMN04488529_104241 [Clostridium gasigenes]